MVAITYKEDKPVVVAIQNLKDGGLYPIENYGGIMMELTGKIKNIHWK